MHTKVYLIIYMITHAHMRSRVMGLVTSVCVYVAKKLAVLPLKNLLLVQLLFTHQV